jgi:VanZ family protein
VVAYLILSILFYWALYPFRSGKVDIRLISIGLCFLYGISDEWHQSFVPGRMPDLLDIVNDVIGACLGMLGVTVFHKKVLKR